VKPARFDYVRPRSVEDALARLASEPGAKLIAGGQSLGPMLNLRLARPSLLVDIGGLPELFQADAGADESFVGAGITHAMIEDRMVADGSAGFMPHVARTIAYRAVRNRGTIGGSIAHADPAADWLLALTALGADVIVARSTGERRIALPQFVIAAFTPALGESEMVLGFTFPSLSAGARFGHAKLARKLGKFADAAAAVIVDRPRGVCRIALGRPEGQPVLLPGLADQVAADGQPSPQDIAAALASALPELDAFERRILSGALGRALVQALMP
jgi:carbon-monoxide dehydrogenase medium subunit